MARPGSEGGLHLPHYMFFQNATGASAINCCNPYCKPLTPNDLTALILTAYLTISGEYSPP
jgi:hypothetical protein